MSKRYENILLDLDGTLVDSAPDIISGVKKAFAEVSGREPAVPAGLIGFQLREILLGIDPGLSRENVAELAAAFRRNYDDCGFPGTTLYPGAGEALSAIKDSGAKIFLVTNKPSKPTRAILLKLGVDLFDSVICSDSEPGGKLSKDEMVRLLIKRRGFGKSSAVMAGDTETDLLAARNNGIAAAAALYGYGDPVKLLALAPDYTLPDISGLPRLVINGR
ncbi:MAG: hypothetical protein COT17_04505 [Elusimicrobia bacterium CG08_land_8_20_14_0_20_51_18]|nr:MAG: hypothetical protein COT17_04505 [Elusimicrobia bacterium CG08_land_8_20_14_0_20_51_18]